MRILLVTPRNPESFWTYDSILPVIGKQCVFPNLSMPTVAGKSVLVRFREKMVCLQLGK